MSTLRIDTPARVEHGDQVEISARLAWGAESFVMTFRGPSHALRADGADAFVVNCLPLAMQLKLDIQADAPVSATLLASLNEAQTIFACWYPAMQRVAVHAPVRADESANSSSPVSTACFFSGGVDSFFSVMRQLESINQLVFVHGFDIPLKNTALRSSVAERMREAARTLNRPVVEVESNVRELTDRITSWPLQQFGASLAAVALLLGPVANRVLIPASESFAHLEPCGSHPLLDYLWSTERIHIEHDGAFASRNDKIAMLADRPEAMNALRVCWENPGNAFNCGSCEKCLRTMIALEIVGALDRCTNFPIALSVEAVSRMSIPFDLVLFHVEENLRVLRASGRRPDIVQALALAVERYHARRTAKDLLGLSPRGWYQLLRSTARGLFVRSR